MFIGSAPSSPRGSGWPDSPDGTAARRHILCPPVAGDSGICRSNLPFALSVVSRTQNWYNVQFRGVRVRTNVVVPIPRHCRPSIERMTGMGADSCM
jgi:hypothetical protein